MIYEYTGNDVQLKGNNLVFFYASYNNDCNLNKEILQRINNEFSNLNIIRINTTTFYAKKTMYKINKIPCYAFIKDNSIKEVFKNPLNYYALKIFIERNMDD